MCIDFGCFDHRNTAGIANGVLIGLVARGEVPEGRAPLLCDFLVRFSERRQACHHSDNPAGIANGFPIGLVAFGEVRECPAPTLCNHILLRMMLLLHDCHNTCNILRECGHIENVTRRSTKLGTLLTPPTIRLRTWHHGMGGR